jgi:AsmA protein
MKRGLRILAVMLGIVILLVLVVPFLIPVNQFRPTIEQRASAALRRQVTVGNLSLSLISGSLAADNLSIADDPKFNKGPFLAAKSIKVGVKLIPLILSKELNITGITIDNPEVTLIRDSAGEWNYSTFGTSGANSKVNQQAASRQEQPKAQQAPASQQESKSSSSSENEFSVEELTLNNGRMSIGSTTSQKRSVYDKVDLTASNVSLTVKFPVTLSADLPGGGNLKLQGNVGPLDQTNTTLTPLDEKLTINSLNLATTGFLDPSLGLGGLLDMNASVVSQNGEAQIGGTGKLSKALLVQGGSPAAVPATIEFRSKYDLRKNAGILEPSTLKIGNAVAHLSGAYQVPAEGMVLHAKIEGQNMPAKDLEASLPAVGVHMPTGATLEGGTLNANLQVNGPTNKLVTTGNVGLYSAKVVNFDLGSKLSAVVSFAGIETPKDLDIEKMTANVRITPEGQQVQNFQTVVPSLGTLVGNGTIDAKNQLDFKMAVTLKGGTAGSAANAPSGAASAENPGGGVAGALGGLFGQVTGGATGALGAAGGVLRGCQGTSGPAIPFQVKGTTKDPKFVPDLGGIAAGVLKSQLGCAGSFVPKSSQQQQQNPNNPADVLRGLFEKKKP